ncbi:acyl-CoA thioesterase [Clostridium botulinum]|uniref:Thioesterase family protein n=1 Tax=Clostridium botulinum (strain Kyoto / Type A2) TaxID=536232 RepID=C1FKA5_CLOBJ|nr:thioesterase family protein [Clostridium botulinum]ACO85881.1 thioesterase family protein [Clostridium botulinum A2 str. Kyoto]APC80928.1 acyl-CoA thioester hydrolase, YbgC/YbaW family protein [Clostridium botulinum]APC85404.1 acyl-CoA thioester hydrolase, YbgC/YbaW family protein [Clostridium botulinum]APH23564.1 acyl-CoA thioester hydrolase, YbgC/YbaW family protein [Clostridium botulinum]APQ68475.1 acyl-CoA thioester hydrolase, YbgC/YbaW family protein [Clostridium botulinum]
MYINRTETTVRYVETDQMGVVHHSNYYPWFEMGRTEFTKATGMKYTDIENIGVMMPLTESYCKYIKPAKYEDEIIIETSIEKLTLVKIIFSYKVIKKENNELLAKGNTTQAFVDKNTFRVMNLKQCNEELWNKLMELCK